MKLEDIKKILTPRINPGLIAQAQTEGIADETIFTQKLLTAMTQAKLKLLIQSPWQLSALCSGLVNYKAPIDWMQTDTIGATPAHYVAWSGNLEQLIWLLTQDKDALTRKDYSGRTAVHYAAWSGNPACLEWLLTIDKDALTRKNWYDRTVAHYVALSGNPDCLEWLLKQDKDALTREDNQGRTIVHFAALSGNPTCLQWLLKQDKDALTQKDNQDLTIVHFAALSGNPTCLQWLLTQDKDALTREDNQGRTAVHYAAWSGNPACLQWLLKQDKDALIRKDNQDCTAAHYVALSGNPACLEWLLTQDKGALTRKDNQGSTAVNFAALSGEPAQLNKVFQVTNAHNFKGQLQEAAADNATIYTTLQKALESNYSLIDVEYSRKALPENKKAIDTLLKRNQLVMEGVINAIEKSRPQMFFFGTKTTPAKQALFDQAVSVKQRACSLRSNEEKATIFQEILTLAKEFWAIKLKLSPELIDTPLAILDRYLEQVPDNIQSQPNLQKAAFRTALNNLAAKGGADNWDQTLDIINDQKIAPSPHLDVIIQYFHYRKILNIPGKAPEATQTLSMDHRSINFE
jgi:ankyrin repeat protein